MKIKKIFILVFVLFCYSCSLLYSAPLRNFPINLTQPNGTIINCFVSGDEYFNWIHDADGYPILLDQVSGYYTYALQENDQFISTKFIVGVNNPKESGLKNVIDFSKINIEKRRSLFSANKSTEGKTPVVGTLNNLVVFIRFSDEGEFNQPISYYDSMFNNITENTNSMVNYFDEVSYNKLFVSSTFYPTTTSNVLSYQDSHPRAYYQPSTGSGSIGYNNDNEHTQREHLLLKNAVNYIASSVPASLNIDGDNDGYVDNIVFIVSGSPTGWSSLLWAHRWSLYSQTAYINGKRVYTYDFQLKNDLAVDAVGVLCHEMFHSLGAPDLYHYTDNGISPVGNWDIMENNLNPPQHMGAHMKFKYGEWIDAIPTISSDGEYTLNSLSSATNNCYKIASPKSINEYFVIEYRKKTSIFESSLPGEGLLVYRIDKRYNGNVNGPPDEVYLFRPNGTSTVNGLLNSANFSSDVNRTFINSSSNPAALLANGTPGGVNIYDIGYAQNTITFKVHIDNSLLTIYPNGGEKLNTGDTVAVNWENFGSTTNYKLEYSIDNGINWEIIADNISSGLKTLNWIVPNTPSFLCKIRLSSVNNPSNYDESDSVFSIMPEGNYNVNFINSLKVTGFTNSVTTVGNKAYICSKGGGLHIVDVTNENNLIYLGGYNSDGSALKVKLVDSTAFLADETKGVKILNISNPANIKLISTLSFLGQAVSVSVHNNLLYVANREYGIRIFDISNLSQPIEKALITTTGSVRDIVIQNNKLYAATETGSLRIFDLSDLLNPVEIGYVEASGVANMLLIKDNYVYLADKSAGLKVIDISNPAIPTIVSSITSIGSVSGISISNKYLAAACESNGLFLFSLNNPASPEQIGFYQLSINAYDVNIIDKNIYVADLSKGLLVLKSDLLVKVEEENIIPNNITLYQNYPNPFNPATKIKFSVPKSGYASIKIYDILGKIVKEYTYSNITSGSYEVEFDAGKYSSGVYLYSLEFDNKIISKKMLLIK